MEIYRHYGHNKFDINKFVPVFNGAFSNKPEGGLWACPTIDYDINWEEWSRSNDFQVDRLNKYFDFKLKDNAKILEIKNMSDLEKLPRVSYDDEDLRYIISIDKMNSDIDFEELSKEYDGMMVWMYRANDLKNYERVYDGIYYKLYGWDVDTLVVFNPQTIEVIE